MKNIAKIAYIVIGILIGTIISGTPLPAVGEENISSFFKISAGEYSEGYKVVRAKIELHDSRKEDYIINNVQFIDREKVWIYCVKK